MVVLDGRAYQVQGSGLVSQAPPQARAPFAVAGMTAYPPTLMLARSGGCLRWQSVLSEVLLAKSDGIHNSPIRSVKAATV
jgi:hypothetical protein